MAKHPHNIQSIPNGTDQVSLLTDLLKEIFCFLASILIFFHPGPPGLVFLQKLINTLWTLSIFLRFKLLNHEKLAFVADLRVLCIGLSDNSSDTLCYLKRRVYRGHTLFQLHHERFHHPHHSHTSLECHG